MKTGLGWYRLDTGFLTVTAYSLEESLKHRSSVHNEHIWSPEPQPVILFHVWNKLRETRELDWIHTTTCNQPNRPKPPWWQDDKMAETRWWTWENEPRITTEQGYQYDKLEKIVLKMGGPRVAILPYRHYVLATCCTTVTMLYNNNEFIFKLRG